MVRDYCLAAVIGFLVGWLVLLPAANLGYGVTVPLAAASVVGFSLFAPLALSVLRYLSRFWGVLSQFGKFAAVGTLNTLLDLGVLNFLIWESGVAKGFPFVGFKAVSFLVASTNSYFWNKFWTFQSRLPVSGLEYLRFVLFTFVGALLNVGVASLVVNVVGAPAGVGERLWANIAALLAVASSFLWNFLNYKHIVFKELRNTK
ncbi:MAG: GtrA family protein [Candidatus Jorgensenbacteria bacterium]